MHQSSMANMIAFRDQYLSGREGEPIRILDLGSMDVNGSYRSIFESEKWQYTGADLSPGNNVDVVLSDAYRWREMKSGFYDIVISGQALEHIEYFWLTILEMERVLKSGGLCCLIAPSGGFEHRYPVDCWRFYPDGFLALSRFAGLIPLECRRNPGGAAYTDDSDLWLDTVLVARKPELRTFQRIRYRLLRRVLHLLTVPWSTK